MRTVNCVFCLKRKAIYWMGHVRTPKGRNVITAGRCAPCSRWEEKHWGYTSMFVPKAIRKRDGLTRGWMGWWIKEMGRKP